MLSFPPACVFCSIILDAVCTINICIKAVTVLKPKYAPLTIKRVDLLYVNLFACVHDEGGCLPAADVGVCQNNLVGIFMSCTGPQLGYRWGVGAELGVGVVTQGQNLVLGQKQRERQT